MKIPIKCSLMVNRLHAQFPKYQTPGSVGMDLYAAVDETVVIPPFERVKIPTGLVFEIPLGFEAQVRPRSGLSFEKGVLVVTGTIDQDFRGEVQVLIINLDPDEPFHVVPGARIAQIVFAPVVQAQLEPTPEGHLSPTMRGINGFGSSGLF